MSLSATKIAELNQAIDEANFVGADFNEERKRLRVTLSPIRLDSEGKLYQDSVLLVAEAVARFACVYTASQGDSPATEIVHFRPQEIFEKTSMLKGSIYGGKFFDVPGGESRFEEDCKDFSFDYGMSDDSQKLHTFEFSLGEGICRCKVWFQELNIWDSNKEKIETDTFRKDNWRAHEAMAAGNRQVMDRFGFYPIPPDKE